MIRQTGAQICLISDFHSKELSELIIDIHKSLWNKKLKRKALIKLDSEHNSLHI